MGRGGDQMRSVSLCVLVFVGCASETSDPAMVPDGSGMFSGSIGPGGPPGARRDDTPTDEPDPWTIDVDLSETPHFVAEGVPFEVRGVATASEGLARVVVGDATVDLTEDGAFVTPYELASGFNLV